jgi:hypothetical protein
LIIQVGLTAIVVVLAVAVVAYIVMSVDRKPNPRCNDLVLGTHRRAVLRLTIGIRPSGYVIDPDNLVSI